MFSLFDFYLDMWAAYQIGGLIGRPLGYLIVYATAAVLLWLCAPLILAYMIYRWTRSVIRNHARQKELRFS